MNRKFLAVLGVFWIQNIHAQPDPEMTFRLKASVAKVHVITKTGGHGVGTGVVVGKDLVATNCHVLANAKGVNITKYGDAHQPVSLRTDWAHDVCILRFKYLELTPVELGDSETLAYEQEVFAIGFPGGPPKPQVTSGKIKALYQFQGAQIVRSDASFVMGASGSPLFDSKGRLVAMNTFKSPGRDAYFYNIPAKWIKALLDAPESTETTSMVPDKTPFWDAPESERPFFMQVVLPYQNEKWADLKPIAEAWVKAEPNSEEAYYYLGVAQQKLGDKIAAKTALNKVLALHPNHAASLQQLAFIAKEDNNQAELDRLKVAMKAVNDEVLEEFNQAFAPPEVLEAK
jgi:serine protease Do